MIGVLEAEAGAVAEAGVAAGGIKNYYCLVVL